MGEKGFGWHFTFDGFVKDSSTITAENVTSFLDKCSDEIEMTKITPPNVYDIGGKFIVASYNQSIQRIAKGSR